MSSSTMQTGLRRLRERLAAQHGPQESDEQLLQTFLNRRDDAAFASLVRRHGPMVLHVCRRVLGHQQDAEDAYQATFLVLAQNAAALRDKNALASFLHGTAYRTAMKAKQSAARRRKHEKQTPARPSADPAGELLWREVRALLDEEIARLKDTYKSVFILCYLENLSQAEAAERLGLKERTVSHRLAEARKQLQQRLARRGVELTALLAGTALATQPASALPPVSLSRLTSEAITPAIAALAENGLRIGKAKGIAAILLATGVLAGGGLWLSAKPQAAVAPPPAPRKEAAAAAVPKKEAKETVQVRGRVLDPDGKPLRAAKLFFPRDKTTERLSATDVALEQVGVTDAEGRFHLTFVRLRHDLTNILLAHADGFGVDWIDLSEIERQPEVTLRLVKDVPIVGKIVNTEGRPLAGISVFVRAIHVPANDKLDDFLAGWALDWRKSLESPRNRLFVPLVGITGAATTDKEGRFTLRGAGGERIVQVAVRGGGVAQAAPWVITRPGFDAKPYNAVLRKSEQDRRFLGMNPFLGLYPPSLTFVAQPGKTIEGAVKDADSGQPLSGCHLHVHVALGDSVVAVSDAGGKYRLNGLPKNIQGYDVSALPPKDGVYLSRHAHAADTGGFTKVQLDIALVQGAVVTGRMMDKQTGKGVECGIRFAPLADNKFFGSKPGFDNYRRDRTMRITDKDGRFRLATIPGKALIMVQVHEGKKFNGEPLCRYRLAVPDSDHPDIFKPTSDGWVAATAGGSEFFHGVENAVKVIEVKEKGETRVELSVDRGVTARIAVQDASGKPLAGAWAAGLTDHWPITYKLPEATATVYALNPEKPRTMAFFHAEKKLGGTATVRGDEKEPVVVKLAPLGQVSGRLLDVDGNPLEGVEVSISPEGKIGRELYRFAAPSGSLVHTDKDGRFRVEGVVPHLKFGLSLRRERTFLVGEPRIGVRQVKPGETLDRGDLRVKPLQ